MMFKRKNTSSWKKTVSKVFYHLLICHTQYKKAMLYMESDHFQNTKDNAKNSDYYGA